MISPSQIDLDHSRVLLHAVDGALAQHGPLMQDRHFVGGLPHKFHVMLDNQHGVILCHALQELSGFSRSLPVMPATGSSSRNKAGSCAITIPISSHCTSPWDNDLPSDGPSLIARDSPESRPSDPVAPRSAPKQCRPEDPSVEEGNIRFSSNVRCLNTEGVWNLRPMPSAAI